MRVEGNREKSRKGSWDLALVSTFKDKDKSNLGLPVFISDYIAGHTGRNSKSQEEGIPDNTIKMHSKEVVLFWFFSFVALRVLFVCLGRCFFGSCFC